MRRTPAQIKALGRRLNGLSLPIIEGPRSVASSGEGSSAPLTVYQGQHVMVCLAASVNMTNVAEVAYIGIQGTVSGLFLLVEPPGSLAWEIQCPASEQLTIVWLNNDTDDHTFYGSMWPLD